MPTKTLSRYKQKYPNSKKRYKPIVKKHQIILSESGRARMLQILHGVVPSIHTFAIITAENPLGQKLTAEENNKRNDAFKKEITKGNFGYFQVKGKYNNLENPLFIINVPLAPVLEWAKEKVQESFVWGEKKKFNKEDFKELNLDVSRFEPIGMVFYYYEQKVIKDGEGNPVKGDNNFKNTRKRYFFVDAENEDNYYTIYKGKKFNIPFFDEEKSIEKKVSTYGRISFLKDELPKSESVEYVENNTYDRYHHVEREGYCAWGSRGSTYARLREIQKNRNEKLFIYENI